MKTTLVRICLAIAVLSCSSKKTYHYVELEQKADGSIYERSKEKVSAYTDSAAYMKAFSNFCISKYTNQLYNDRNKVVSFKLVNDDGQDISSTVQFESKFFYDQSVEEEIALRISKLGKGSADIMNAIIRDSTYRIMVTDHNASVQNYHIEVLANQKDDSSLQAFVESFRKSYCSSNCNIFLYDDNSIKDLVTKYPLPDDQYIKVADHFVAQSTFDAPKIILYPFQDIKYKQLGGTNWRKRKIK